MSVSSANMVSLVVPTFNQAQYLGACLDSIFFQDYPNLEIIIVNDASTDHTRDVIDEWCQAVKNETTSFASNYNETTEEIERSHHKRFERSGRKITVLHNKINLGSTHTYNRGFHAVTGEYCSYIASDDICHPQMISELVKPLENDSADFVYSDCFIFDNNNRIIREFRFPDYDFTKCFSNWYLLGVSKLYRRKLHEQLGFYDNNYLANDHECYLRFALNGVRFHHIPKTLYSIRIHDRDRQTGVHSSDNWTKLLNESKSLVHTARKYLKKA